MRGKVTVYLLLILVVPVWLVGCVSEDWTGCHLRTVHVVARPLTGHDALTSEDVGQINLYVFRANDGVLLETIRTTIGVVHTLPYEKEDLLHLVAVANCNESIALAEPEVGQTAEAGGVNLLTKGSAYLPAGDLFWGEVRSNNTSTIPQNIELPVHRVTALIRIRVSGLENKEKTGLDDLAITISTPYTRIGFDGQPRNTAGVTRTPYYLPMDADLPQVDGNIIASHTGETITLFIYAGEQLLAGPLTEGIDTKGQLVSLNALNGKLNAYEIVFGAGGEITLHVNPARWINGEPVDKEF